MTRETKIGLLVGLAFIIVIGILLSDHMTSTTQPPQAMLESTRQNLSESMTTPAPAQPAPARVDRVPQITPANPVPTRTELQVAHTPQQPVNVGPSMTRIEIGGPANGGQSVSQQPVGPIAINQVDPLVHITGTPTAPPANPETEQPQAETEVATSDEADTETPGESTAGLEKWLQGAKPEKQPTKPAAPAQVATREYVAQPGDSLSRMASRLLGSDTKANRDAIIAANASLQKNPDLVIEGRKYAIPQAAPTPTTPAAPPTTDEPSQTANADAMPAKAKVPAIPETVPVPTRGVVSKKPVPVTDLVDPLPSSAPADGGGTWYVVKANDTLWGIASQQLGSGSMWKDIKDMNKDVLKGKDTVQANMRLRLPAKPVVSARAE